MPQPPAAMRATVQKDDMKSSEPYQTCLLVEMASQLAKKREGMYIALTIKLLSEILGRTTGCTPGRPFSFLRMITRPPHCDRAALANH
jgi:hypothetical protein